MRYELHELRRRNAVVLYRLPDPDGGVIGEPDGVDSAAASRSVLHALDDLVETTRQLFGVQYAGVHVITADSQTALAGTDDSVPPHVDRADSMCAVALDEHGDAAVIEIPDAACDPVFDHNPFVHGDLGSIRFYAAVPLRGQEGITLGTLCIASNRPRGLDDLERRELLYLGYAAVHLLDQHRRRVRGGGTPGAGREIGA